MRRLLLPLVALAALAAQPPALRLPPDTKPLKYELDLQLDPASDRFSGSVAIDVQVAKAAPALWLHSSGLEIQSATINGSVAKAENHGSFLGLSLPAAVAPGKTRIEIRYSGAFNLNDVEGLFKQVERGDAYVFTQFEPTSARRAFPCFDEPSFKTPWHITIRVPAGQRVFANTPEASRNEEGGRTVVRFAPTKPLPTYLVAMAVGPFDIVDGGRAGRNRTPIRTIALRGRGKETQWTNQVTPKILVALEDFFGIPYPYEKLDQITIPITVGFGAMENAGLITYQQTLLLAQSNDDSESRRRVSAIVIAHEIAHQWFGNMVTPAWWDDIWLNEAFASWMEDHVVATLFPQWNPEAFAVEQKSRVMSLDSMISARRIRQPIENEGDIGGAFDGITYQKGSAVIRMFEHYAGSERFQRGVRNYIRKHAWGNATAADFLASISSASGQNLSPAFAGFLDRGGLPLVSFDLDCTGKPTLRMKQSRSLPIGSKGSREEYWSVPVCVRYQAGGKVQSECFMLADPRDAVVLKNTAACPDWLMPNPEGAGYYHWLAGPELGKKLADNASQLKIHEQVDWLRNALALSAGGHMPISHALQLARQFAGSPHRQVVEASLAIALGIRKMVPAEQTSAFAAMLRSFYGKRARELGWLPAANESADAGLLRVELLPAVARLGSDPALAAEARKLADSWLKDQTSVPTDIAGQVLRTAAYHGDEAFFRRLLAAAKGTKNRRDRALIITAMGSFRDPAIARKALALMLSKELDIRELTGLLTAFGNQRETDRIADEFIRANYDTLVPLLPAQLGRDAASILPGAATALCSTEDQAATEAFYKPRMQNVSGGARRLAQTLEQIGLCAARKTTQASEVSAYLRGLD